MTHTPHELTEEFPDHAAKIHDLRQANAHFAKLTDEYHDVNRAVHRAETDVAPTSDDHMAQMRSSRLRLKHEIAAHLAKA